MWGKYVQFGTFVLLWNSTMCPSTGGVNKSRISTLVTTASPPFILNTHKHTINKTSETFNINHFCQSRTVGLCRLCACLNKSCREPGKLLKLLINLSASLLLPELQNRPSMETYTFCPLLTAAEWEKVQRRPTLLGQQACWLSACQPRVPSLSALSKNSDI